MPLNPVLNPQQASRVRVIAELPLPGEPPIGTKRESAKLDALIAQGNRKPFVEIMDVTPAMAQALMAKQRQNRNLRRHWVQKLTMILEEGRFSWTNDALVIDTNGELRNGQHRLTAIINTGISGRFSIMFGVDPATADAMDTGAKRSAKDFLEFDGIKYGHLVAAIARMHARIEQEGRIQLDEQGAHRLGKELVEQDDTLDRAMRAAYRLRGARSRMFSRLGPSPISYAYWKIANESRRKLSVDEFWDHLVEGHDLGRDSAIFKLRNRLAALVRQEGGRSTRQAMVQTQIAAWIIQTWNCWLRGQTSIGFKWTEENKLPEVR